MGKVNGIIVPGTHAKVKDLTTMDKQNTWILEGQVCTVCKLLRENKQLPEFNQYAVNFPYAFRKEQLQGMPDGYEDWYLLFDCQLEIVD